MSLADLEQHIKDLPVPEKPRAAAQLGIKIDPEPDILADIWTAILCGTLCRRADTEVIFASPAEDASAGARFTTSLAGLACASMASIVRSETGTVLDVAALKRRIM